MVRGALIESILMAIYGQKPTDDAEISDNLVNMYIDEGIAVAAQKCYNGNIQLDGIGYVNNGFYSTFSGISISQDGTDNLTYKLTLPQVPVGIGSSYGLPELRFRNGSTSFTGIPLTMNQWAYYEGMPIIPNKILYLQEGSSVRMKSTMLLTAFTGTVKLISGGDSTDLNSTLNVPPDYIPIIRDYAVGKLLAERSVPQDNINDGTDENLKQL